MISDLCATIAVLFFISVVTERLATIFKPMFPRLAIEKKTETGETALAPDRPGRLTLRVIALAARFVTNFRRGNLSVMRLRVRCAATAVVLLVSVSPVRAQKAQSCAPSDSVPAGLTGVVNVNGSLTRATQDAATVGGTIVVVHNLNPNECGPRRQRTLLEIRPSHEEKRKKGQAAAITRNHSAFLQHLVFLPGNRLYVAGNARWLHNNSIGVDLQQMYGLVAGGVIERGPLSLELSAGPGFVGQNFVGTQESTGFWGAWLGETGELELDAILSDMTFHQTIRVVLPFSSEDPWIGYGLAALRLPLTSRLSVELSATDEYISNPPAGSDKNYFSSTVGLSLTF